MEEITKQVKNSQSIKLGNNLIKRYHQEVTNQAYQKRMYLIIILNMHLIPLNITTPEGT